MAHRLAISLLIVGGRATMIPGEEPAEVGLHAGPLRALHDSTMGAIAAANQRVMTGPGLVGVQGGAEVQALWPGERDVLLSLPQATVAQVPLTYAITTDPAGAVVGYRFHRRDDANLAMRITLSGGFASVIKIEWSAVVLFGEPPSAAPLAQPAAYLAATACVQSADAQIKALAEELGKNAAEPADFAAAIQSSLGGFQRVKQPRSLDALGHLDSRDRTICTANANLAAALLRAQGIPARTVAVVPPLSARLEMHRIVEYFDAGRWLAFDPSSLQNDIPLAPWQSVVMAITTPADENVAMQPRASSWPGAPYGHELELLGRGVRLYGNNFFWTMARPLAQFDAPADALQQARRQWRNLTTTGKHAPTQTAAAQATTTAELVKALADAEAKAP